MYRTLADPDISALCAEYISPNAVRHQLRRKKGEEYTTRSNSQEALKAKIKKLQQEKREDPLAVNKVFA